MFLKSSDHHLSTVVMSCSLNFIKPCHAHAQFCSRSACVSFELSSANYQSSVVRKHDVTRGMDPSYMTIIVMLDVDNLITQDGTALKRNAHCQWNINGLLIYNVQAHTSMHMRTHVHMYTCMQQAQTHTCTARPLVGQCRTPQEAYMLSPRMMYSPKGTSSTPDEVE